MYKKKYVGILIISCAIIPDTFGYVISSLRSDCEFQCIAFLMTRINAKSQVQIEDNKLSM